ncbi:hypothetical protein KSP40_PGU011818 [Platanthera guangdongensis]|uniref:Ternary complex factor MIP1, leucine-zipper n=1 Tax=Platanthera guangdongensis TaxID=2320717 RepID=A0ABR2MI44_9ASPA
MQELRSQRCELKAMELLAHKRSKSDDEKRVKDDMFTSPNLKEIVQLERRLKNQLEARNALENALGCGKSVIDTSSDSFMPKPAKELIREIAVLELEVMHLEQYLLSLYRKAFDQQIPKLSHLPPKHKQSKSCQRKLFNDVPGPEILSMGSPLVHSARILPSQISSCKLADESCCDRVADRSINRCHSALNQRVVYSSRISPSESALARALQDCDSQPLSFLTDWHDSNSGLISLAEYLGTSVTYHVHETPNKISEDMLKCMGAIYSKLSDPPLMNPHPSPSPSSSVSSMSGISPRCAADMWSPGCRNESVLDSRLVNPFRVEGLKEFSGPYNFMVEVSSIRNEDRRLKIIEILLNTYKSLVFKLATINVKKMKNDEKVPFWINLHNALMMHAYLVHGVPRSSTKRYSLIIKATCVVGGHSVNADLIQGSFLGGRTNWIGQWLRTFKLPAMKSKKRDEWRRIYAIEKHEPLLHFALCLGSHSDPAVRIYTADGWHQQLETAKEEYIRATIGIHKDQKIFLPKLIESYVKERCMNSQKVVDMIQQCLPETMRMAVKRCQKGAASQNIEWVPHNFSFRFLLSREVANIPQM